MPVVLATLVFYPYLPGAKPLTSGPATAALATALVLWFVTWVRVNWATLGRIVPSRAEFRYASLLAIRYLASKKGATVSIGTVFATLGVTLGVAALSVVMSVTGGFQDQFREKVLGVNAHVLVLKYSIDFREYREVMEKVATVPGVKGVAPFIINPMMITHGNRTATGVLLKGVDPERLGTVLDLPRHVVEGTLDNLRKPGAKPPERTEQRRLDPAPVNSLSLDEAIRRAVERDRQGKDPEKLVPPTPPQITGQVTPQGGFQSKLPDDDFLPTETEADSCKADGSVPSVAIGRALGRQLDAHLGECLQITSPTIGVSFGSSGVRAPIAKQFRITAIFEAGFEQYDAKLVYTDLYEAEAFYEQGDSVTGVEMKVDDINRTREIAKEIDARLGSSVYHTMDWMDLNSGLFTALFIQQIAMSVVLALIIVVAAFTVIATLIMIVLEKQKEIALLKAIGATDRAILMVFLFQGGLIGATGTALGLLLGFIGCKALSAYPFPLDSKVYFISKLPVNAHLTEFSITGAVALTICLIATIFPSIYAARLRPSDGLRAK